MKNLNGGDQRVLTTQNRILELIATGRPFQDILDSLCLLIEEQSTSAVCSILLIDKDNARLRSGAGPSAPQEYMDILDGLNIGKCAGSCGTAAFLGKPVIVADVEHDPLWKDFQEVASRFNIKACWSTPFFSSTGAVLGTFAISHAYPCAPSSFDERLLQTASYLAGIATESHLFAGELIKSQRLESIGVLAGGMAHDFNNLLISILGNISLAKLHAKPGDEVHRVLSAAENASLRARDITLRLLTFARGGAPGAATESISDVVEKTAGFVLLGSKVRWEASFDPDIRNVEIDKGQVSQVIQNVLVNASQAMPMGGAIGIRGETVSINGGGVLPLEPGDFVRVSVTDEGIGIPVDHQARIFEPFFSTKDDGRGLGLATSYSIMKQHGGCIDVQSRPGEGTTFYLYFPVSHADPDHPESEGGLDSEMSGTVLVMDDEDSVRRVMGDMLTALGCKVEFTRDGNEAVELFEKRWTEQKPPFDLVILDLTVPGGMGGDVALRHLKKIDPTVKAVATSGYTNDPVLAKYDYGFVGRLAEPY